MVRLLVVLLALLRAFLRRHAVSGSPTEVTPDLSPASPLWLRPVMFDSECEVFGCSRSAEHSLFSPQALGLHPVRRVCRHHAEELVWLHGWMGYDRASGLAWRRTAR